MPDQWTIRGVGFTNCSCAYGCPCQFNAPSTNGYCKAVAGGRITEGHFNDTRLDGLNFAMTLHFPGEIAEGNGTQQLIVDERGTPEQREAIRRIYLGESTTPGATFWFIINSLMTTVHETLYLPIDFEADVEARKGRIMVPGVIESVGTPIKDPFSDGDFRAQIRLPRGMEYTVAEVGNGTSKVTGALAFELEDSYGQFNIMHMNQDGVIR